MPCLNPVQVPVKMRPTTLQKHYRLEKLYGVSSHDVLVPCGKCIECLKKRQNDLAVRAMREASKRGSMCFLTLTYNETSLPLHVRLERVDKETGECYHDYPSSPLVRYKGLVETEDTKEFVDVVRGCLNSLRPGVHARVVTRPFFETDDDLYRYEITPSLNRRDVRLWFKRCRVRYLREKGEPLSDFSYIVCGEYGPKTCRPHYHIALFGLTYDVCKWLACQWDFGFTNLKKVDSFNPDGSNGFEIASKYIGKYMSKGKFDCDSVQCGLSEKPRLMLSKHVGTELPESLVSYFRCYDVFGRYDVNSLLDPMTNKSFTKERLLELGELVRKRAFLSFGSSRYCLPKALNIKVWYNYDKTTHSYKCSILRLALSHVAFSNNFEDFTRQLLSRNPGISHAEFVSACSEFISISQNSSILEQKRGEENLLRFYASSVF